MERRAYALIHADVSCPGWVHNGYQNRQYGRLIHRDIVPEEVAHCARVALELALSGWSPVSASTFQPAIADESCLVSAA
jgi:hypothetical protein